MMSCNGFINCINTGIIKSDVHPFSFFFCNILNWNNKKKVFQTEGKRETEGKERKG